LSCAKISLSFSLILNKLSSIEQKQQQQQQKKEEIRRIIEGVLILELSFVGPSSSSSRKVSQENPFSLPFSSFPPRLKLLLNASVLNSSFSIGFFCLLFLEIEFRVRRNEISLSFMP
jgi:hypothetical protein